MKRGKTLLVILSAIMLLVIVIFACIAFQRKNVADSVYMTLSSGEKVYLYQNGDVYYALLPAYTELTNTQIHGQNGYKVYVNGACISDCGGLQTDQQYSLVLKDRLGFKATTEKLIIKKASNVPAVSIHLSDGELMDIHADQQVRKSGTISVRNDDGSVAYIGAFRSLGGRGNSTWAQPKKSYQLSFDLPVDLLGMCAATDWVLLGNPIDESGLRNKLVYDTAKAIGLKYAVDCEYIDLYVNNRYVGLYLLSEQVEIGENRINITNLAQNTQLSNQSNLANYSQVEKTVSGKIQRGYEIPVNPSDITGGYLVQIEYHEDRILNKSSLFQTDSLSLSISSPKYASMEQVAYISEYINETEKQLQQGNLSRIDIESFAKLYLLQEVFANADRSSVFWYKDTDSVDGKIYAGPVWDFDLSIGNGGEYFLTHPTDLYRNKNNWFQYLEQDTEFQEAVSEYFSANFSLDSIEQRLVQYKTYMENSFIMNRIRWENHDLDEQKQVRYDTLDEHITCITGFMENRLAYLESLWAADSSFALVSFISYDFGYYSSVYVQKGDTVSAPLDPNVHGYRFAGWFDAEGNSFSPSQVITEPIVYTARWEQIAVPQEEVPQWRQLLDGIVISKTSLLVAAFGGVSLIFILMDLVYVRKSRRQRQNGK